MKKLPEQSHLWLQLQEAMGKQVKYRIVTEIRNNHKQATCVADVFLRGSESAWLPWRV